jgi:cytochrome oxidase Cu insertion factor (SCO1/SenC/PrrC family)
LIAETEFMNRRSLLTLGLGLSALPALAQLKAPSTHLKVGDMAPDFTLPSTTGDKVTLSSFRGNNSVVLAFFPAAFTGG